jgi:GNAT superfamily N-acetyltransferase
MNDELLEGYEFSTDPTRLDAALVHAWLSQDAYWAMGRPREKQDRAIATSLNFGVYESAGRAAADGTAAGDEAAVGEAASGEAAGDEAAGDEAASGAQVGYARVVTDESTFAWLCDVYIAPEARGKGLGTALVAAIRDHLAPFGLRRILLATADAHGVYAKVGFEPLAAPEKWMAFEEQ